MNLIDQARQGVAMHPEVIKALEQLADALGTAGATAVKGAAVSAIPLGGFLSPVIGKVIDDIRAEALKRIDHALDEFIQAQPTTFPGSGIPGLDSIEEIDTPKEKP